MSYPYLSDFINHLFGTQIHIPIAMFGSFVALAIMAGIFVGKKEVLRFTGLGLLPKGKLSRGVFVPIHEILTNLVMVSVLAGIVGARVFHIFEYPAEFIANPMGMIFSDAGLSIYGGLIFGFIAGAIFLKRQAIPILPMLDALAPALALGYGIGRIGCQISGDGDWGIAANMALKPEFIPTWLWAQTYENNVVGVVIQSPGVYPTPIYEALTAFLIFSILWAIRKKTEYSKGFLFSIYLLLSGFARLLVEKIRINSEYQIWELSFTQAEFISVVLIIAGLAGILKSAKYPSVAKMMFSVVVLSALSACTQL